MTPPNVLLIVSDEERRNDWLDGKVDLPAHQRLRADGGLDQLTEIRDITG